MQSPTTIAFVVNGDFESAMGYRARALAEHLPDRYEIHLAYRSGNKIMALVTFLVFLSRLRPDLTYVFDMSYSGVLAGWVYRVTSRNRLVIETGDVIYELMRSTGNRSWLGLRLTRWLEEFSLRAGDRIVVRSRYHQQWLAERSVPSDVIQDGVDVEKFGPLDVSELRRQHGLDGILTVGLVGTSIWSEKLSMCYGWELIELLRLLPNDPIKGVIIGDGSGIPHLKARCREYGVEDRVLFMGRIPQSELPAYLNMIDVCLSTQTNDLVGRVRTSGKLPLYLASGRYVLATEVGEAAALLEPDMLVPYDGVRDPAYPARLAERVRAILAEPQKLRAGEHNVALAKEHFAYEKLAHRLGAVVEKVMRPNIDLASAGPHQQGVTETSTIAAQPNLTE